MRTGPAPLHLLFFGETLTDDGVDGRLDEGGGYPLSGPATLAVIDQPQQATGKGLRGHRQLRRGRPLRRIRHAAHPPIGPLIMTFETDSENSQ